MAILEIEVGKEYNRKNRGKEERRKRITPAHHRPLGSNPREIVQHNFNLAASALGLSEEQRLLLKTPFREVKVEVPVRMDDGSVRVFLGYRISAQRCSWTG